MLPSKFLVVYHISGVRQEKWFDSETEAAKFCKQVDGCVVKINKRFKRSYR